MSGPRRRDLIEPVDVFVLTAVVVVLLAAAAVAGFAS